MKKTVLLGILTILLAPFAKVCGQTTPDNKGTVETFANVLKTAEWASFDYKGTMQKALEGDVPSMQKFVKFHATVDGVEGINHGVTCLELIPLIGDAPFASACNGLNPKLQKLALDRFVLAQGKTKKEELRQPMANWAPMTWSVFTGNGLPPAPSIQDIPDEKKSNTDAFQLLAPTIDKGKE